MNENPFKPRLPGINPGDKSEKITATADNKSYDSRVETEVLRIMMTEAGITTEEARQKVMLDLGRLSIPVSFDLDLIQPTTETADESMDYKESLAYMFISKGTMLGKPIDYIEQIYDFQRKTNDSPNQETKIKIVEWFKSFVETTIQVHNLEISLRPRFNDKRTIEQIEASRLRISNLIKDQKHRRINKYKKIFKTNKLIGLGIINKEQVEESLTDEVIVLINYFKDRSSPDYLDKSKVKRYLSEIDQYKIGLYQED